MNAPNTVATTRKVAVSSEAACLEPGQIADRLHDSALQSLSAARQQLKKVEDLPGESCTELTALMKELRTASEKDFAANI